MFDFSKPVRNFNRWREVQSILFQYGFDFLIDIQEVKDIQTTINRKLNLNVDLLPKSELSKFSLQQRVRLMLQELGPTYVKLGQLLSSRRDLLPQEWIQELSKLQDEVPAFPFSEVEKIIEKELGYPIEQLFLDFDPEPIAAASIAQVHSAKLLNEYPVVVKVRRPKIYPQINSDIEIIYELARLIENRTNWGKKYGVSDIIDEFHRTLNLEMDFRNEATNAIRLRRILQHMPNVHVPSIYWNLTSEQVLTMEYIEGVKITDVDQLEKANIDRNKIANVFIQSIFKQLLIDGFYHADPHPGNIFVNLQEKSVIYLDLGMMGRLLPEQRQQLADIVQSIVRHDSRDVTRLVMAIGSPFEEINERKLRRSIDHIINRYLEVTLENVSFSSLLTEILTVIFDNGIRLPSDLSLAIKTIIQSEEIAHTLDKDLSIMQIIQTVSKEIFWESIRPSNLIDNVNDFIREFNRLKNTIPPLLESIIKQVEKGSLKFVIEVSSLQKMINSIIIISNRLVAGLIIAGTLIGSALIIVGAPNTTQKFITILGVIGFTAALVLGFIIVWSVVIDIIRTERQKKKQK